METLESFTSLLSIMSFKLFPSFLFLTSPLFSPFYAFRSSVNLVLLPPSLLLSPVSTGLWVISIVSHSLLSPSYHPTACHRQSVCMSRFPGWPPPPPPPFLALVFLTSLISRRLLVLLRVSAVITLRNHSPLPFSLGPVEGVYSILRPFL